jgi:hypothetical protein
VGVKAGKPSPLRQVLFAPLRWEVAEVAGQLLLVLASRWSPSPAPLKEKNVTKHILIAEAVILIDITLNGHNTCDVTELVKWTTPRFERVVPCEAGMPTLLARRWRWA